MEIPDAGFYLWQHYFDISQSVRRVRSSICEPIPPSEFLAWMQLTRKLLLPVEYAILREMDRAFCAEVNKEISDYNERVKSREPQKGRK